MSQGVNNPEDEATEVTPFMVIQRGEDTLASDQRVVFADFSPQILPADAPEEVEKVLDPAPKDSSVPELVDSSLSETTPLVTSPETSVESVPVEPSTTVKKETAKSTAAGKEDGLASPTGS